MKRTWAVPGTVRRATGAAHIFYLWKASQAEVSEPGLVGQAAWIAGLPVRGRRLLVAGLFVLAAAVIVASAEPFASSLIGVGTQLGIDRFLLVQWVAPLASEAPEFIVAILFAVHGKGGDAIGTLISSKVNQWTLLVGSLPVAYLVGGGGGPGLTLDGRQVEEFLLTATQALLGVTALLVLRFPRWLAFTLLGLFAVQYALPGQGARYLLSVIYAAIALAALACNHRHVLPTLAAPFRDDSGRGWGVRPDAGDAPRAPQQPRRQVGAAVMAPAAAAAWCCSADPRATHAATATARATALPLTGRRARTRRACLRRPSPCRPQERASRTGHHARRAPRAAWVPGRRR